MPGLRNLRRTSRRRQTPPTRQHLPLDRGRRRGILDVEAEAPADSDEQVLPWAEAGVPDRELTAFQALSEAADEPTTEIAGDLASSADVGDPQVVARAAASLEEPTTEAPPNHGGDATSETGSDPVNAPSGHQELTLHIRIPAVLPSEHLRPIEFRNPIPPIKAATRIEEHAEHRARQ